MKIRISKSQWQSAGKRAGWTRAAGGYGRFSEELCDIIEGQVLVNKNKSSPEIAFIIKTDEGLLRMMQDEQMSDTELLEVISGAKQLYRQ